MHIKRFAVGVAAVAAAGALTAAPANAAGKWAAVAYSPDDSVFGWSVFNDSEHDAQSRAVFNCVGKGGTSCQVAGSVVGGCIALADNETHYAAGVGPSTETAEHNAAAQLGGIANILISTCSG